MAAENDLYQKLVKEMDTKNAILQENCTLLKEKVELLHNQVYKNKKDYTSAVPVMPGSRATTSTACVTSLYCSVASGVNSAKPKGNLAKPTQNHKQSATTNNNQIRLEQVKAAIHEAQSVVKVREIQNLSKELAENNNAPDGWKQVKRRRRFIVGRNQNLNTVQTVPKYMSLHVSRLQRNTKPEELEQMLNESFPGVSCEPHISMHPEIYASMKVNIRSDQLKDAWKKDVWPNGILGSLQKLSTFIIG
nr:unnamed protein product [Callosobruchus analis]